MKNNLLFISCVGFYMPSKRNLSLEHGSSSIIRKGSGVEGAERRRECTLHLLYVYELVVCLVAGSVSSKYSRVKNTCKKQVYLSYHEVVLCFFCCRLSRFLLRNLRKLMDDL